MAQHREREETLRRVRARAAKMAARASHGLPVEEEPAALEVPEPVIHVARSAQPAPRPAPLPMPTLALPGRLLPVLTVAIIVLVTVIYRQLLQYGFAWKDYQYIVRNPVLRSYLFLPDLFIRSSFGEGGSAVYRPLTVLSYLLDYQTWADNPVGYHATNLTLHLLCTVLVYVVAYQLFSRDLPAMAAAALFAVYPIQVEAVGFLVGRADLLVTFWSLLASIAFLIHASPGATRSQRRSGRLLVYLFAALATFSKETGAFLIVAFLLWDYLFRRSVRLQWRQWLAFYAPLVVVSAGYLGVRAWISQPSPAPQVGRLVQALGAPVAAAQYLGYLAWPFAPTPFHSAAPATALPAWRVVLITACFLAALGLLWAMRRRHPVMVFIALCGAGAVLTSGVYLGPVPALLDERMLYLPMVALALLAGGLLAAVLRRLPRLKHRAGVGSLALVILVLLGWVSTIRAAAWLDETALWRKVAEQHPGVQGVYSQLGNAYMEQGEFENAARAYASAIAIAPEPSYFYNLGNALLFLDRPQAAIWAYRRAVQEQPVYPQCYYNMGTAYLRLGATKQARAAYEEAARQAPRSDIADSARAALKGMAEARPPTR